MDRMKFKVYEYPDSLHFVVSMGDDNAVDAFDSDNESYSVASITFYPSSHMVSLDGANVYRTIATRSYSTLQWGKHKQRLSRVLYRNFKRWLAQHGYTQFNVTNALAYMVIDSDPDAWLKI